jgi:acyl-coenzyme A synthetase/AMP-(fatty) acid ligase
VLIDLLRTAAAVDPNHVAVASGSTTLTYGECLLRSEKLAHGLGEHNIGRFGCQLDDAEEIVPLLCGSSAVEAEACIYPSYLDDRGVADLARTFDHEVVVTSRKRSLDGSVSIPITDLAASGEGTLPSSPAHAPVMILTTGTTGHQRGARHDWSRLVGAIGRREQHPGGRWLLAYNLNQFAGIQMLLHVLVSRATLIAPSSNQPAEALRTMRELHATHASATPTFWRFVVSSLDEASAADLSLEQITLGGEAVPERLLTDLRRLFPRAKISQIYGATEFGLGLSVRDGRPGLPASLLQRGDDADVQVKVVDGQLYTRSKVGMLGYYGEDDVSGDYWMPTGDLVELRGDRIYFVGRITETVNVGGVKVHPLPVEEAVSKVSGVALVHAYGRPNPVSGQIMAVDVVARPGTDQSQLRQEIRDACTPLAPAARPRSIRFVETLDVRDQKIARGRASDSSTNQRRER